MVALWLSFFILIPLNSYASEEFGKLEITAKFTPSGDRAGPWGIIIKIYKDGMGEPYRTLLPSYTYPYFVTDLPLHHNYIIETYVNDQLSDIVRIRLDSQYQKISTNIHFPAGLKFHVFYNDNNTPLPNAVVDLFSHNRTLINHDLTDTDGRTGTAWIAPNIHESGYYKATISLGEGLEYNVEKIRLRAGEQRTIKVVTPWPKLVESLITVTVYENKTEPKPVKEIFVEMFDSKGTKISESQVDHRGRVFFSLMPVGNYLLHLDTKPTSTNIWKNQTITITGKADSFQLFLADLCYLNCTKSINQTNHSTIDSHTIAPDLITDVLPECCFANDSINEMAQDLRHSANLWTKQKIDDVQFAKKIKIILAKKIESNPNGYVDGTKVIIPKWLKTTAEWLAEGKISDIEFAQSIEYLMQNNILIV